MKKIVFALVASLLIVTVLSACGSNAKNDNSQKVGIGYFPNLDHAAGIVAKSNGYFEEEIPNATIDYVNFPNGNDFISALETGSIQLGYVGPGPAINYYLSGGDVVILSAAANGATLIVARDGSGIESLEDFGGKSFCTPGNGCTHNVQLEIMLKEIGLESERVGGTVIHQSRVDPANMIIQFEQNQIDAAAAPEPWGTFLVEELGGKVVAEWDEVFLGETLPSVVLVTSKKFAKENPDVVRQAVQAHQRAVDFANNNVAETLDIVNEEIYEITQARLPIKVLENAWKRMIITTETHADALQAWADASYELQFIDTDPVLDGFVDTSVIDELVVSAK